ncbi:histidine kinase [Gilvimarinus sp. DA14]|uniref:histidine kinase n=1 Tax=Gilvimarinus sp. DA14 TaxID=2956798 RepID=UPI0020B83468|nr:histidine kinase [Gilvimarinus sp. DA14]UTF59767.1 histidine kinase [Gilvimarinus sp. DA14]
MDDNYRKLIHDARNPLNNISVHAELSKLALQTSADIDKAVASLDVILTECQRCSATLQQLADELDTDK